MSEATAEKQSETTEVSPEEAAERIAEQQQGGGSVTGGDRRPTQIPPDLAKKLVKARSKVSRVAKNGHNKKFSYVRAEDVIDEAKKGLDEANVIVLMEISKVEVEPIQARSGSPGKMVTVDFEVSVIDGDTGEGYIQTWKGCGADHPGDKAIYKAQTGATKYFLASLLGIPFGDDPETVDGGGDGDGGSEGGDTYPASEKQVSWGSKLLADTPMPEEAKEAIKVWIGGTSPQGPRVSRLIELLKPGADHNPRLLAQEAGWDGEITTSAEPSSGQQEKTGDGSAPETGHENDPRVVKLTEEIAKAPGLGLNQVIELMRASGITPPAGDNIDRAAVIKVLREISDEDNAKLTKAVITAREAKQAAEAAKAASTDDQGNNAPTDVPTEDPVDPTPTEQETAGGNGTTEEINPNSVLGQTVKLAESLGVDHLLEQLAELLFDVKLAEVPDTELVMIGSVLNKSSQAEITAATLGACIRQGIDNNKDVADRNQKFREWIDSKLEDTAATKDADKAGEAAEGSQEA